MGQSSFKQGSFGQRWAIRHSSVISDLYWSFALVVRKPKHVFQIAVIARALFSSWTDLWYGKTFAHINPNEINKWPFIYSNIATWASCQIRKIAGAHAPGMPGTFSPSPQVSDPDMHHGTCVTHVPGCMPGSLTSGFIWNRRRGKTFPAFPAHAQHAILRIW